MSSTIRNVLWKAAEDSDFRRRLLSNLSIALPEEGFILTDAEMAVMRGHWEALHGLTERAAYERISALARAHPR